MTEKNLSNFQQRSRYKVFKGRLFHKLKSKWFFKYCPSEFRGLNVTSVNMEPDFHHFVSFLQLFRVPAAHTVKQRNCSLGTWKMFLIPEERKSVWSLRDIYKKLDARSSRLIHLQVIAGGKMKWPNFLHNITNTNTKVCESTSEKEPSCKSYWQFYESKIAFDWPNSGIEPIEHTIHAGRKINWKVT